MTNVSEQELLDGIKEIVLGHYTILKEAYNEVKEELYMINQQLSLYCKFLNMVKKPKDVYKKNVLQYYHNNIKSMLIEDVDEIIDVYDDSDEEAKRIDLFLKTNEGTSFQIIKTVKIRERQLNLKKESIGDTNIYSNQISRIKRILKSLNSNMFFEDEPSFNNIIEYISESDIIDSTKKDLLNCIVEKRNKYLEKQQAIKEERGQRKKLLEQEKEDAKKSLQSQNKQDLNITNTYKFNDEDFFSDEDLELIKIVNNLIYKNIAVLNNINEDIINLIKESLEYKELNIDLDSILPNHNISNYNNIVILFEIRKIINQITSTFEFIKSNNISDNNLDKYKEEIFNHISEINKLYNNYVFEQEVIEERIDTKNEKHIIYVTNSSGEILLKNDIKGDPDNYKYFIEILDELKKGIITQNHHKDVRFTNNGKLSDVCKKKNHYARLVYCPYDDCYIVFAGFIKKNSNNNYELNLVKNRYSFYKSSIDNIMKDLSDIDKKAKLIEENDRLHDEFMNYLKTNSRAKKKELKKDLSQ